MCAHHGGGQHLCLNVTVKLFQRKDLCRFNSCDRIFKDTYFGPDFIITINALDRMGLLFACHIIVRHNSSAFMVEQN